MNGDEICKATISEFTSTGGPGPHVGLSDKIAVTIMDGKRTVVGICEYCHQSIIAQEPEYHTRLAPSRSHHKRLPRGMWRCSRTRLDHMPAAYLQDGQQVFECIDCNQSLSHYQYHDNLTGEEYDVFLSETTIDEEPF